MQSSGFPGQESAGEGLSSQDVSLSGLSTQTEALVQSATMHLSVRSMDDLSLYEEHSSIIQRLCKELGFQQPATAMAWVFDQLEQSKDLQKAIFDLLND